MAGKIYDRELVTLTRQDKTNIPLARETDLLYYLDCRLEFNSDFVVPHSWQTYLRLVLNQPAGAEKRVYCMANNSSLHVTVPSPPPQGVTFPLGEGEGTATRIYLYLLAVKNLPLL